MYFTRGQSVVQLSTSIQKRVFLKGSQIWVFELQRLHYRYFTKVLNGELRDCGYLTEHQGECRSSRSLVREPHLSSLLAGKTLSSANANKDTWEHTGSIWHNQSLESSPNKINGQYWHLRTPRNRAAWMPLMTTRTSSSQFLPLFDVYCTMNRQSDMQKANSLLCITMNLRFSIGRVWSSFESWDSQSRHFEWNPCQRYQ